MLKRQAWTDVQTKRRLRIAYNHLESFPRMKYNNQIITKEVFECVWRETKTRGV